MACNCRDSSGDEYIYELTDGIIGDNYPVPDRMLIHIEKIVHNYLMKELCQNKKFESTRCKQFTMYNTTNRKKE